MINSELFVLKGVHIDNKITNAFDISQYKDLRTNQPESINKGVYKRPVQCRRKSSFLFALRGTKIFNTCLHYERRTEWRIKNIYKTTFKFLVNKRTKVCRIRNIKVQNCIIFLLSFLIFCIAFVILDLGVFQSIIVSSGVIFFHGMTILFLFPDII